MCDLKIHQRARHKSLAFNQAVKIVGGVLCEDEALCAGLDSTIDERMKFCPGWRDGRLRRCITEDGFSGDVAQ